MVNTITVPECPHCGHTNYKVDNVSCNPGQCLHCGRNPLHFTDKERASFVKAHKKVWEASIKGKEQEKAPECTYCSNRSWQYVINGDTGAWVIAHCKRCGKNFVGDQPKNTDDLVCLKHGLEKIEDYGTNIENTRKSVRNAQRKQRTPIMNTKQGPAVDLETQTEEIAKTEGQKVSPKEAKPKKETKSGDIVYPGEEEQPWFGKPVGALSKQDKTARTKWRNKAKNVQAEENKDAGKEDGADSGNNGDDAE